MDKPKWLNKEKSTRERSDKQETELAKKFGGRKTAGSGSVFGENDVVSKEYEIEAKTTAKKQITIKLSDIKKMRTKSSYTKIPLFAINFEVEKEEFILISLSDFLEISGLEKLK